MGFLKKLFQKYYLLISFLLISGCTQPIAFRNLQIGSDGYFMFGKATERNFYNDISISDSLKLLWTAETNGSQSYTSIVVYNDALFVNDLSGRIYAFDRKTGKLIGYEKLNGAVSLTPVVNESRLYFIYNELNKKHCYLQCYDLLNGKVLSEAYIEGNVTNELLKVKDGILVLTNNGELIKYNFYAFKMWSGKTGTTVKCSPASDGKSVIFGNQSGELISAAIDSGKINYRSKICSAIEGGLTINEKNVFFGDVDGYMYCADAANGNIKWKFNSGTKILVTPVVNSTQLFFGNLAGDIYCLDKNNGKLIWKIKTAGVINTTPLLFNNYLIQPDLNKKIYIINSNEGKIAKTLEFERRSKLSPVYYDGILYVGTDKGIINAYQTYAK
jgi:outer membrane protein assembly factor BamB